MRPRRASQCESSHRADAAVMSSQSADQSRERIGEDAARRMRSVAYLMRQGEGQVGVCGRGTRRVAPLCLGRVRSKGAWGDSRLVWPEQVDIAVGVPAGEELVVRREGEARHVAGCVEHCCRRIDQRVGE